MYIEYTYPGYNGAFLMYYYCAMACPCLLLNLPKQVEMACVCFAKSSNPLVESKME